MADNINLLTCEDIKENLKSFFDDLLLEDEYQSFVSHVNNCPSCKKYVQSVGSLSNQIWQLADIKSASDLSSTVLFKILQNKESNRRNKFSFSNKLVLTLSIIIILLLVVIFYAFMSKSSHSEQSTDYIETGAGKAENVKKVDRNFYEPGEESAIYAGNTGIEEATSTQEIALDPRPLHWHFKISESSQRDKLKETIELLGIDFDYDSKELMVFSAQGEQIARILKGISTIAPLYDFTKEAKIVNNKVLTVVVFIEDKLDLPEEKTVQKNISGGMFISTESLQKPITVHWHIFAVSDARSELQSAINRFSGSVQYELNNLFVFNLPSGQLKRFIDYVKNIEGVFIDYSSPELEKISLSDAQARFSIFYREK